MVVSPWWRGGRPQCHFGFTILMSSCHGMDTQSRLEVCPMRLLQTWANEEADQAAKHALCNQGIDAVIKMVFQDNFVHGDLHPGNILVTTKGQVRPRKSTITRTDACVPRFRKRYAHGHDW